MSVSLPPSVPGINPSPLAGAPSAPWPVRVLASVAGIAILLVSTAFTLGVALVSLLGVAVVSRLRRRVGRSATPLEAWFGAVTAGILALALAFLIVEAAQPAGSFEKLAQEMRTQAKNAPPAEPPAWLRPMQPRTPANAAAEERAKRLAESTSFFSAMMAFTGVLVCLIFGSIGGTLGWAALSLLLYGVRGRWTNVPPPTTAV